MNKLTILSLIAIFIYSCSGNKEKVIKLAENHLKENMKDPASYERVEVEILDTVTEKQYWEREYKKDSLDLELAKLDNEESLRKMNYQPGDEDLKADYQKKVLDFRLEGPQKFMAQDLDSLKTATNDVKYYSVFFKYRAKNGFGALDLGEATVQYYPSNNSFKIKK